MAVLTVKVMLVTMAMTMVMMIVTMVIMVIVMMVAMVTVVMVTKMVIMTADWLGRPSLVRIHKGAALGLTVGVGKWHCSCSRCAMLAAALTFTQEQCLLLHWGQPCPAGLPPASRHMNLVCLCFLHSWEAIVKYFSVSSPGDTGTSERDRKEPFIFLSEMPRAAFYMPVDKNVSS